MGSANTVRWRAVAVLLATAALGLAACGDDEEESTGSAAEESTSTEATTEEASAEAIDVVATEYAFDVSATPSAETKSFSITNDGEEFHVMLFAKINEGFTLDEAIELEGEKGSTEMIAQAELPPGQTVEAKVESPITAGEYAMICPVETKDKEPHYELGQLEEYTIE